jgi:uncharacterized protein (DUF1330 family)
VPEPISLCVLLWAKPGCDQLLFDYEDRILDLIAEHGGEVLARVRSVEEGPTEVQILRFASELALAEFQHDEPRGP